MSPLTCTLGDVIAKQLKAKQQCLAFFCLCFGFNITVLNLTHAAPVIDHWQVIQDAFYAGQTVSDAGQDIVIQGSSQAEDASLVPITVDVHSPNATLKRVDVFVDANPIPLTVSFFPQLATHDFHFSTRIRLESNSVVRVVAEDVQGLKRMQTTVIKTPGGGCGGGLAGDEAKLRAEAGRMKLNRHADQTISFHIKHPMRTGFERTTQGYYAKAWYMKQLHFYQANQSCLLAELGPGISADPYFRIRLHCQSQSTVQASPIQVEAEDNEGKHFTQAFAPTAELD